jgi:hypothetical protein
VQDDGRDVRRAGLRNRRDRRFKLLVGVAEEGQDRRHQHAAPDAGLVQLPHHVESAGGRGSAWLDLPAQLTVDRADGQRSGHIGHLRGRFQEVEVAQDQCALGEDRERIRRLGERGDDVAHQLVAAFDALVAVDVGAHGDVLVLPGRFGQLATEDRADVGLHHDLRVEVMPRVEVEVLVRLTGEAVDTRHAAAAIRVDRPAERHPRRVRNLVQRRPAGDLVEGDALKFRGVERAGHSPSGEQRHGGAGGDSEWLVVEEQVVPPHGGY